MLRHMNGYQRRKQQKRDSIRRAALELFNLHGTKRVSMTEIAARAGVNPVTVYNHFGDKEGLIRDVLTGLIETHWTRYRELLESPIPFMEKLKRIVIDKSEMARLHGNELLRTALSENQEYGEMIDTLYRDEVTPLFIRFIQDGQERGFVRKDLSTDAISLYIDMFTTYARTHPEVFADQDRLEHLTQDIWNLFLYGLIGKMDEPMVQPTGGINE